MQQFNYLGIAMLWLLLMGFSQLGIAQTTLSLKSQWLDPTNLFTEKKPTGEVNTVFSLGKSWSGSFYYAHNLQDLTPIYLIGGVNHVKESGINDSLGFRHSPTRHFARLTRNLSFSYQYSETVRHLSWFQPIFTWDWMFVRQPSKSVHKITAEVSGFMSLQRDIKYQDGGYATAKYSYAKHYEKWIVNALTSTMAIKIVETGHDFFVLGQVLKISTTYLPFKTTLEVVLNKPLITKEDDKLGFTVGLVKEM